MDLTLTHLSVSKEIDVTAGILTYIYTLTGACCSTDALWLKQELMNHEYPENMVIDLADVSQTDLIAVNALVAAHRRHSLRVVMPQLMSARHIFHLTKFEQVLNTIPTIRKTAVVYA